MDYAALGMLLTGGAAGIWGLVIAWDTKRKFPVKPPPQPPAPVDLAPLSLLPLQIEAAFERAMAKMQPPPMLDLPEPDWHKEMLEDLTLANERVAAAAKQLVKPQAHAELQQLVLEMTRVNSKLEELIQRPLPEPPVMQSVELTEVERKLEKVAQQLSRLAAPTTKVQPDGEEPSPRMPRAVIHPGPDINLTITNTLALTEDTVYRVFPPEPDIHDINVFNLGPGTLTFRFYQWPDFDDPECSVLPPSTGFNTLHVPKEIFFLADTGGVTLSITVTNRV